MVLSQTILADVVPAWVRGRYLGVLRSMFGIAAIWRTTGSASG
jgi:hypothetical protein